MSSNLSGFTALNGALYFSATDGLNGRELWKTDGTTDGTVLVKTSMPNPEKVPPFSTSPSLIAHSTFKPTTVCMAWNYGKPTAQKPGRN